MSPEECLRAYGEAWFERDSQRRREVLARSCTEDVVFMDPALGRLEGIEAVSNMIGHYMEQMAGGSSRTERSEARAAGMSGSGVGVDVVAPLETLHRFFRYSFVWSLPNGSKLAGTDFGEFAEDGRMRLITVWPATPGFPVAERS